MADKSFFVVAQPVWLAGRAEEMNLSVGFRAAFSAKQSEAMTLRVTASSVYRAMVNGEFVGYGPARGPHGWYRVDEWDLKPHLRPGRNVVALEVAGYNTDGYYPINQPSFVQAEVRAGVRVVAATGEGDGFLARPLTYRVRKVARYTMQRAFTEVYRLSPEDLKWRTATSARGLRGAAVEVQEPVQLLPRGVALPDCRIVKAAAQVARGRRLGDDPNPKEVKPWPGFAEEEVTERPWAELAAMRFTLEPEWQPVLSQTLAEGEQRIFDFGTNLTGFLRLRMKCERPARLFLSFDELLIEGDVNFLRMGCLNVVSYALEPGEYDLEAFEPYTLRYLKVIAVEGECEIGRPELRTYAGATAERGRFACSDQRLDRLFEAGRETFRQNALDIFMDCPSRERAGWLCDSFFTSPRGAGPDRGKSHRAQLLPELPLAGELRVSAAGDAADVLSGGSPHWQLHPELGDVVRGGVGGISRAHRRPGDGEGARAQGARAARLSRAVSQCGRPPGEAAELGVCGVVEVERFRAGRELPEQHAVRGDPRRGGAVV